MIFLPLLMLQRFRKESAKQRYRSIDSARQSKYCQDELKLSRKAMRKCKDLPEEETDIGCPRYQRLYPLKGYYDHEKKKIRYFCTACANTCKYHIFYECSDYYETYTLVYCRHNLDELSKEDSFDSSNLYDSLSAYHRRFRGIITDEYEEEP